MFMFIYVYSLHLIVFDHGRSMAGHTGVSTMGDYSFAPTAAGSDNDLFVHRPCHCGSDSSQKSWHRNTKESPDKSDDMWRFEKGENN